MTVTVIDGTPDLSGHRRVLTGSDAVVLNYGGDDLGDPAGTPVTYRRDEPIGVVAAGV